MVASPSLTSNQSLPNASTTLGLCETMRMLVPAAGTVLASLRSAAVRRLFSLGETHQSAFGDVGGLFRVVETGELGCLVGAVKLAGDGFADRYADLLDRDTKGLCGLLSLWAQLSLLGDIVGVERVAIGLIGVRSSMSEHDDVPARFQQLCEFRIAGPRLGVKRASQEQTANGS